MNPILRIPASRHAFDLWRLGESGGYLEINQAINYFCFSTAQQYDAYLLLGNSKSTS